MRPEERDPALLLDMVLAARDALEFLGGRGPGQLEADRLVLSAVEHQLIVLGEAAARVSGALKAERPDIPWAKIVGMRNILVHEYGRVDVGEIARTVHEDLPDLLTALEPLLPTEPPE
jgi:uncharacterized protein with HEPN domain